MEDFKTLNPEDIKELRKKTKNLLKDIPEGKRVDLGKELTELLLFDERELLLDKTCEFPKDYKSKVKFLVWSGKFLRKLDLSSVSFDDVLWNVEYYSDDCKLFDAIYPDFYEGVDEINLSNTNARIDFSQSFEGKICRIRPAFEWICEIVNCNFKNVDLSNNTLERGYYVSLSNCNFVNTGINIDFNFLQRSYEKYMNSENNSTCDIDPSTFAYNCDFRGLDFRKYKVGMDFIVSPAIDNSPNDYTGTGIKIDMKSDYYTVFEKSKEKVISKTEEFVKNYLSGCVINDKDVAIANGQERQEGMTYDLYKDQVFNKVEDTINSFKRRM